MFSDSGFPKLLGLALSVILAPESAALTQASLTDTAVAIVIDFDAFTGSGFKPAPSVGQLDSDTWSVVGMGEGDLLFGGTATSGDFARGTHPGGIDEGGVYAFDVSGSGDYALGIQPTADDMTPGTITLRIVNDTGMRVDEVAVLYDLYVNNDEPRANDCGFSYSTQPGGGGTFTAVPAFDYTSPEAADALGFRLAERTAVLTALGSGFEDGDSLYLRWRFDDVSGSFRRDEFAFDNVVVMSMTIFADGFESGTVSAWSMKP